MENYQKLENFIEEIRLFSSILGIISWDQQTMMPQNAVYEKVKQISLLQSTIHNKIINPKFEEVLNNIDENTLSDWQKSNVFLAKKAIKGEKYIPSKLVEKLSNERTSCLEKWKEARQKQDFNIVKENLKRVLDSTKEISEIKSQHLSISQYDSLIDSYDPGRKSASIDKIFDELEIFLKDFLPKLKPSQSLNEALNKGSYPIEKQKELAHSVMKDLRFDFTKGRLDESAHPFCAGGIQDVRLTTFYFKEDFTKCLYAVIHETGHALYNQGLPQKWIYQLCGSYLGLAVHESQSLFFEKIIGKSLAFCQYVVPKIKYYLNTDSLTSDALYNHMNRVEPSLIRIDADEVTYNMHVIIRYRIEKVLFNNEIDVDDLEDVWNEYYQKYLGIKPNNVSQGVLQDIHWYMGIFGYFPSYALGSLISAQIKHSMEKDITNFDELVQNGDFNPIVTWLRDKIHSKGSLFTTADELLKSATGQNLDISYFKNYLKKKYTPQK